MTAGKPMSSLAQANMRAAQQRRRLRERPEHWSVTVSRSGETIVTIESDCLSGRDITPEDEQTIRTAAHHLLSFIGDASLPQQIAATPGMFIADRDGEAVP